MKLLLIICLFYSSLTFSKSTLLDSLPCSERLFDIIASVGTPQKWTLLKKGKVQSKFSNGSLVEITSNSKEVIFDIKSNGSTIEGALSKPECKLTLKNILPSKDGFSDKDLDKLLKTSKRGIIYIWSPHMSLSVAELISIQNYRKSLGVTFTILMDLRADKKLATDFLSEYKLPLEYLKRLDSRKLEDFGSTIHFPSSVYYKNGKLIKRIPGHNGKNEFTRLIKKYL